MTGTNARFFISERQEDGTFIVSFRCDKCDYALTQFYVLETEIVATNERLVEAMPSRHYHSLNEKRKR